jgi:hypothetical protein
VTTCELAGCTRPTRDAAYVCDDCGDGFARDLKALVDWLDEDLETSVAGAKGVQYRAGRTTGGEAGLRVNWRAAALYRHLQRALCDAVDHCLEVDTRHSSPDKAEPARTISAMALWLTWRVDGLSLDPKGPKHAGEIGRLVDQARELVFWVPPERRFLGACDLCKGSLGGHVYAEGDAEEAFCNRCATAFPAEVRRAELLAKLDDRLLDAADIARLSTHLGLHKDREKVRKQVNQWRHRRVIEIRSGEGEDAKFRFGDVWRRLVAQDQAG